MVPVKQNKSVAFAHKVYLKLRLTTNKIHRTLKDIKKITLVSQIIDKYKVAFDPAL